MFTGLIEKICTVKLVSQQGKAMLLTIELGNSANATKIGDSVAINGVCLTVTKLQGSLASFDVSTETLAKSTLGRLKASSAVNFEPAMKADGRFGGHFVQGHIDGTAIIKSIERQGLFANIKFEASGELLGQMIIKGSVAVDGISLTIANMDNHSFGISVIPETLKKTTLGTAKAGDSVNIETDIIVKTVKKQLEAILPQRQNLTMGKLKELGF